MKRFEKLVTKNSQNIYEGLEFIRNDKVQKQRGLEYSPLDSITYYDGTVDVYGGSKDNSNYSYEQIIADLESSTTSSVNPYTSSGGASTGSSSNMGY